MDSSQHNTVLSESAVETSLSPVINGQRVEGRDAAGRQTPSERHVERVSRAPPLPINPCRSFVPVCYNCAPPCLQHQSQSFRREDIWVSVGRKASDVTDLLRKKAADLRLDSPFGLIMIHSEQPRRRPQWLQSPDLTSRNSLSELGGKV